MKESSTEKWNVRFLDLARFIAAWSKDPSTKVGAVLVRLSVIENAARKSIKTAKALKATLFMSHLYHHVPSARPQSSSVAFGKS